MRTTTIMHLVNRQTLDILRKSISKTIAEATPYLNSVKEKKKELVFQKISSINSWYTKIIGLDEVKQYQDRVTALQEQLLKTQEKRREVGKQLSDIRQKSLELQDEIHKVKRQDDLEKFLDLMKKETEILKMEKSIEYTFQDYDQMERELFTAFSNAIRDSHEKQRAQIEYTKYFGLVLSIAGSFLAFCYSTLKKQDLKNFIEQKLMTVSAGTNTTEPVILNLVQANKENLQEIIKNREALKELMKVVTINNIQNKNNVSEESLQNIQIVSPTQLEQDRIKYLSIIGGLFVAVLVLSAMRS